MKKGIVAIVGRANVGKSTLFNRIIGERVSIVEDVPGVTRDRIYAKASWLTKEFRIIDTGGIELKNADFREQIKTQAEIAIEEAENHIFGMVLLNDWSARDIQQWEYVPLGPFNSKTFGTSISPWVVTLEALEPFRCASPVQEPQPLPYLREHTDNNYDIKLQVAIAADGSETVISNTNFKYMYWSMMQQLTHHTIAGCNVRVGDLMGSGTISGPDKDSRGSLLELTWNTTEPLTLVNGEQRGFLEDGDTLIMRGHCEQDGLRIGFGEVRGTVLPAKTFAWQQA